MPLSPTTALLARWLPILRRRWAVGALLTFGGLVLAGWFDATWWRPVIQHHVHQRSGRQVAFEDLDVGLGERGGLVVVLKALQVQNAPWARPQPLITARELRIEFPWRSLWAEQFVITRLSLVDAQVDLERRADGLRNWRLTRPDDRGPGRVRVMAVDALRTQAHIADGALGLALNLVSTPLSRPAGSPAGVSVGTLAGTEKAAAPLAYHVALEGSRRGVPFKAQADVSRWVTLMETGEPFNVQGELSTPRARLTAQGLAADVAGASVYRGQWAFEGQGVGELAAVLGPQGADLGWPLSLPVQARGSLDKQARSWRLAGLEARLGRSDVAGELSYDQAGAQAGAQAAGRLAGSLRSERLDTAELRQATAGGERSAAAAGEGLQADVDWRVKRLAGLPPGDWEHLEAHVALRGRQATLFPLKFQVWGGEAAGRIHVDSSAPAFSVDAALEAPGLPLSRLAGGKLSGQGVAGQLAVKLKLSASGDTAARLLASVQGEVTGELLRTSLPEGLEARVGLDGGRWLRSLLAEGDRVAVSCSAVALDFDQGIGQVRQLAVETPHLAITGRGRVDLPGRSFELWLAPRRKQSALLALDRWLHLQGGTGGVKVATVPPSGAAPASACRPPG